jgi:putative FmdB family regulatory protein
MPIYEYKCSQDNTHKVFEVERSILDPESMQSCPECKANAVRHFTPFGIQFKGNGFYKTDNPK